MTEQPTTASESAPEVQPSSYVRVPIGAAAVWAAILLAGRLRLPAQTRSDLEKVCSGWWMGFTAASIARLGATPPKPLTPAREKTLQYGSLALVMLGLSSAVHLLWSRGAR